MVFDRNDSDSLCRLAGSLLRLRDSREFKDYELDFCSEFDKAGREVLARVHSEEYLSFVSKLAKHQRRIATAGAAAVHAQPTPPSAAAVTQPSEPAESSEKPQQLKSSAATNSPTDSNASTNSTPSRDAPNPFFSASTFTAARRSAGEPP